MSVNRNPTAREQLKTIDEDLLVKGTRRRGLARLATRINGMWFDYGKRHVQRPGLTNVVAELPRGRVSRFSIRENFTPTF
jgi:hypothetical protein